MNGDNTTVIMKRDSTFSRQYATSLGTCGLTTLGYVILRVQCNLSGYVEKAAPKHGPSVKIHMFQLPLHYSHVSAADSNCGGQIADSSVNETPIRATHNIYVHECYTVCSPPRAPRHNPWYPTCTVENSSQIRR